MHVKAYEANIEYLNSVEDSSHNKKMANELTTHQPFNLHFYVITLQHL